MIVRDHRNATASGEPSARVYKTSRGHIEAAVFGSGSAVLLVHGTLGNWRQLLATARDLADRHTVLLVSRPGYGATPVANRATYEDQASLYAALLDTLHIERTAMLGASAAAPTCVAFAAAFPERCDALVLCGALAPHLASTRGMWATAIPGVVRIWVTLERRRREDALRDARHIRSYLQGQLTESESLQMARPEVAADLADFVRWTSQGSLGLSGLLNDIRNIRSAHRMPPSLMPISAPTLVLHGDQDSFVPVAHALYYRSAISGATLELMPGGAHLFLQVFRRETSERIGEFLDRLPPRKSPGAS